MSVVVDQKAFLATVRPFDRLTEPERVKALKAMDIAYFRPGEELLCPRTTPEYLYIILKGVVREIAEDGSIVHLPRQDTFDGAALLNGCTQHCFTVEEELICYLLPRTVFQELCAANPAFHAYYYEDLSARLAARGECQEAREMTAFMMARVEEAYLHAPLYVDAVAPLREAASLMNSHRTSAVLVRRGTEIGIVTTADLSDAVIVRGVSREDPVGSYATFSLVTLDVQALLFDALLRMTHHGLNHLVITQGPEAEVVGVLEQVDLLSFFSSHSYLINLQIERATSVADLHNASGAAMGVMRMLSARGVKMRNITRLVSELDHKAFRKLYGMLAPAALLENTCLVVMGSEGRGERVFKGPQDHVLLLRNGFDSDELPRVISALREAVQALGYPPYREHAPWVKSVKVLRDDLFRWVNHATPRDRLNLAMFSDATAVAGDATLLEEARNELLDLVHHDAAYLAFFAKAVLSFETPLSLFAHFTLKRGAHQNELDIKQGGIFTIVHGVRALALQRHLRVTNTVDRLQILAEQKVLDPGFAQDLREALDFMNEIRLKSDLAKIDDGLTPDHYIRPLALPKIEQDLLRDSLKVVVAFKKFLTFHFHLERML
ncbi:CBS domain-containing protein [Gammaproteobacteria bacterium]